MYGHPTATNEWRRSVAKANKRPLVRTGFYLALTYIAVLGLSFVIQYGSF